MASAGEPGSVASAATVALVPTDLPPKSRPTPGKLGNPGDGTVARIIGALTVLAVFVFGVWVFYRLLTGTRRVILNDFYTHLAYILHKDVVSDGLKIAYPLFHRTTALLMAFLPEQGLTGARQSAAVVLALALAARTWLSYREVRGTSPPARAALACLLLLLAMALPNWWRSPANYPEQIDPNVWWKDFPSVYLGIVNPNVWHNPTTIFAAPFALLLFHQAILYLKSPGFQLALSVGVAAVLCALAKPNYLLAFLPSFGLVLAARAFVAVKQQQLTKGKALLYAGAALLLPLAALIGQFLYTFTAGAKNGVVYNPWAVWSYFVDPPSDPEILYQIRYEVLLFRIPWAIFAGIAFPCAVTLCFPRQFLKDLRLILAWLVLAVGVAQYGLLAETYQWLSGNFFWSVIPACYILFVASCGLVGGQPRSWRTVFCLLVLAMHAACGVICLTRALMDPPNAMLF